MFVGVGGKLPCGCLMWPILILLLLAALGSVAK